MLAYWNKLKTYALAKNAVPGWVYIGLLVITFAILGNAVDADQGPPRPDGIAVVSPSVETISAYIKLQVSQFEQGNWTAVQWQAADGIWHDVDGWQGNFWNDGTVLWWVYRENLGQQRFRWIVYKDASRVSVTQVSRTFNLPSDPDQGIFINMNNPAWVAWSTY